MGKATNMEHSSHEDRMALWKSPSAEGVFQNGGGIRLRTELLVSNQHLMIHMDKEDLVTQARGLRNQLTLDNDYYYE